MKCVNHGNSILKTTPHMCAIAILVPEPQSVILHGRMMASVRRLNFQASIKFKFPRHHFTLLRKETQQDWFENLSRSIWAAQTHANPIFHWTEVLISRSQPCIVRRTPSGQEHQKNSPWRHIASDSPAVSPFLNI